MKKYVFLFFLIVLVSVPTFSTDIYVSSLPAIAKFFACSKESTQLTLTSYMAGFALSMLLSGFFADIWGIRSTLLFSLSLYILASIVCYFANTIEVLIIARFFQALGGCAGTVLSRLLIKDKFPLKDQIIFFSWLTTGLCFSAAIAPIVGSSLAVIFGWRSNFLVLILIGLAMLVMSYLVLDKDKPQSKPGLSQIYASIISTLSHRQFIKYTLIISFAWAAYFGFITASPFIYQTQFGLTPIHYGYIIMLLGLFEVAGSYAVRSLNRYYQPAAMTRACSILLTIISLFICVIYWLDISLPYTFSLLIYSSVFVIGILMPCCQFLALNLFPKFAGIASAIFFFTEMLFGGLGSLFVSQISAYPLLNTICLFIICGIGMLALMLPSPASGRRE